MKRKNLFNGKLLHSGEWIEGNLININDNAYIIPSMDIERDGHHLIISDKAFWVNPETVGQFTGKTLFKCNKVFEGTIAFYEEETDDGDIRTYLICVWIDEWSMFAWLTTGEYIKYQDMGIDALDEESFWSYTLENSEQYHYAGNIFDNTELLNQ